MANALRHPMLHEPIVIPPLVIAIISGVLAVWGINIETPADPTAAPVAEALNIAVQIGVTGVATAITAYLAAKRARTNSPATLARYEEETSERLASVVLDD